MNVVWKLIRKFRVRFKLGECQEDNIRSLDICVTSKITWEVEFVPLGPRNLGPE